ncbi:MAG: glycoside hydrolase [Actinomycetota bacterium]|nr:glycoside hydrolase [Actinomycetota bacterium]
MAPRRCSAIPIVTAVLLVGLAPALPAAAGPPAPGAFQTVRFVQRVSEDAVAGPPSAEADTETEPDIAVDPNDPDVVVAVFQQGRFPDGGSVDPGFATSHDGGQTWVHGNLPGLTTAAGGSYDRSSDPAVAFGPDGSVYATTLPFDAPGCRSAVSVQRSDDGGLTWEVPAFPEADDDCKVFNDKNWMTVDTFPGSPHFGRVYVTWDQFRANTTPHSEPIVLRYSDDRGATWSDLVVASAPEAEAIGVLPVVEPNGDLAIVYDDFSTGDDVLVSQVSHDGGVTFDPEVKISRLREALESHVRTGGLPAAAVDPVTGRLFAVWQDDRFRTDGHNDVVIARSSSEGAHWSRVKRVNPGQTAAGLNSFSALTPDVAAYGGIVHVTYRTRDDSGPEPSNLVQERYVVSIDGGKSFGGELLIGPRTNLRFAAVSGQAQAFLGDYMGVAATADTAYLVWCVARRPAPGGGPFDQTTWSATIVR